MSLKWWQKVLCRYLCPRWEEDRPRVAENGPWVAASIAQTNRGEFERDSIMVDGDISEAYEMARWLALCLAFRIHHDIGVKWAVRRP